MTDSPTATSELDHAYFQALEEAFIRLRGAPLLLSPADWQVAREWRRQGVPIELAVRVMERIFQRQEDSNRKTGIRSLLYFRTAIEGAWRRVGKLGGAEPRDTGSAPMDISVRLERLAAALPSPSRLRERTAATGDPLGETLAGAIDGVAEEILSMTGSARQVEGRLQSLEQEVMARLRTALDTGVLASLEESVAESLAAVSDRMAQASRDQAFDSLVRRRLRKEFNLPALSLFSPEARAPTERI